MELKDKVAIVTGAGQGIGWAIAERFAREGAQVVLGDIQEKPAQENARRIAAEGGRALALQVNVAKFSALKRFFKQATQSFGPVDILVNNAGQAPNTPFLEVTEAEWDRVMDVNLKGPFLLSQLAAQQMVARGGVIINLASVNSVVATPNQVPYVASKGGIGMLTKAMAVTLAPHGIRVVAVGPGVIQTPLAEKILATPEGLGRQLSRIPMGRVGIPEEIASVAAFMASDEASYLTGTTVYVDGGRLALNGVLQATQK